MPIQFPKLLTPAEAALLLRVSPGTLAVWRSTKRYPLNYLKLGHAVRYREADVLAFLEKAAR
jgi:hypothetical protein